MSSNAAGMKLNAIGSVSTAPVSRRAELDAVVRPGPTGRPMGISQWTDDHGRNPTEWTKGAETSRTDQCYRDVRSS